MARHAVFEWDSQKAAANLARHGVRFDDAAFTLADAFGDRFHIEEPDLSDDNGEERWITMGTVPTNRAILLVIVWTMRGDATRIISARTATNTERRRYEQERP